MGVFEDTIINIKEAVDMIGKKTGKVVDVSKLKLSAAEVESDIKKSFEKLGEIVYNKGIDEISNEDITKCISHIDKLYVKLGEIKNRIAQTKNRKKCPNCDFENDNEALFCSRCGKKLLDDKDSKNEKEYEIEVDAQEKNEEI